MGFLVHILQPRLFRCGPAFSKCRASCRSTVYDWTGTFIHPLFLSTGEGGREGKPHPNLRFQVLIFFFFFLECKFYFILFFKFIFYFFFFFLLYNIVLLTSVLFSALITSKESIS